MQGKTLGRCPKPRGRSGSGVIAKRKTGTYGAEVGALIVPPAIDPGKPSSSTPPGQARLCQQDNQRARKFTGNMYTRSRA